MRTKSTHPMRPMMIVAAALALLAPPAAARAETQPEIGVKKGQMYPDFRLPTIDGKQARLSDYRGKKVLLFHFASW